MTSKFARAYDDYRRSRSYAHEDMDLLLGMVVGTSEAIATGRLKRITKAFKARAAFLFQVSVTVLDESMKGIAGSAEAFAEYIQGRGDYLHIEGRRLWDYVYSDAHRSFSKGSGPPTGVSFSVEDWGEFDKERRYGA